MFSFVILCSSIVERLDRKFAFWLLIFKRTNAVFLCLYFDKLLSSEDWKLLHGNRFLYKITMVSDSFDIWRQMLHVRIISDLYKIVFRSWVLACILWLLEPPGMQALANCPISWWYWYFLGLCVFGDSCGQLLRHWSEAYRRSRSSEDIPRNVYTLRFSCRSSHVVWCGWRGSILFFRCRFQHNLDTWIYIQDPSCWEAAFYPY